MKKLILSLFLILNFTHAFAEEKVKFKHPFFYQQLYDCYDFTMYLLTPTSKFFDLSLPKQISEDKYGYGFGEVDCTLLENEEEFIKMKCNDCTDFTCKKHQERINTFEIVGYDEKSKGYHMKHKVIDIDDGSVLRENLLRLSGIIAIKPDEQ